MLTPNRLCDLFQNLDKITDNNLRGSSTRLCIPMPKTEYLKKVSVMMELKFGSRYLRK